MSLEISESSVGSTHVVALSGIADVATVPALVTGLSRVLRDHGAGEVAIDLDRLSVLDDAPLGVLLGAAATARQHGGEVTLICSSDRIRQQLSDTRVDAVVAVRPTLGAPAGATVAVVFSSQRTGDDEVGYQSMAARMDELAREQRGFAGIESARNADGFGITVSYWGSERDARAWKQIAEHLGAQRAGRDRWYSSYQLRVATINRAYEWQRPATILHIALPKDWAAARAAGEYTISTRGLTLAEEGFIHCSCHHQAEGVANRFYADLDELVLLEVDPARLRSEVIVEAPFPGSVDHFPHIYGPIDLDAVIAATNWHRPPGGEWRLP